MAEDINIVFSADTSQLDQAITKVKNETQNLVPGGAGSGVLTQLPRALGGPSVTPLLDAATAAAKRNTAALGDLGTAGKKAGQDMEDMGRAAQRGGINIGSMMERIAVRLVVFEALRLAIKGLVDTFKEVAGFELARTHFENLSKDAGQLQATESSLMATTKATNIEFAKLSTAVLSLEDAGDGPVVAAAEVDVLAKRAAATGSDVDALAKALERVKLDQGTIGDMYALAHAAGTAKDQLLDEIIAYQRFNQEIKESERVHDSLISKIEIAEREWEKEGETAERAANRAIAAQERELEAFQRDEDRKRELLDREQEHAQRVNERRLSMAEKLAQFDVKRLEGYYGKGRVDEGQVLMGRIKQSPELLAQYRRGIEALNKEEGVNAENLVRHKIIGIRDVMDAGRAAAEEDRRQRDEQVRLERQAEEDQKRAIQEQARVRKQAREDVTAGFKQMDQATKDLFASQKEAGALAQAREKLRIENELVTAMGNQSNIQAELAKTMGTVSEKFASIATSLKEMIDKSPQVVEAMQKIANLVEKFAGKIKGIGIEGPTGPGHEPGFMLPSPMSMLSKVTGVSDINKGMTGMWENIAKAITEQTDHAKRTADATEAVAKTLTSN